MGVGTIQHEMAALPSSPSNVKHPESLADVISFPGSGKVRALCQCLDGFGQGIGTDMSLSFAEMLGGPPQDISEVRFSSSRQTNPPAARWSHPSPFGPTEGLPTVSPASADR